MQEILMSKHHIRVAYTYNPYVRSVCFGVFVGAGSRFETPTINGISHMIEHMCFKGTARRTALALSKEMDELGANFNAYTSKEITAYYVQCIDDCVEPAVDILSDLVLHHTFPADEMEKEKEVVLEEIDMCADAPEDLVSDVAGFAHWGEDPLGYTVLGAKDNIRRFTPDDLFAYERARYVASNVVLSVVGNISREQVLDLADRYFAFPQGEASLPNADPVHRGGVQKGESKGVEQTNLIVTYPGLPYGDPDTPALSVLDSVLGGAASSILFQKLREEAGLAYSVYSYPSSYAGAGAYSVYVGTNPSKADKAVKMIADIVRDLRKEGIDADQLRRGRQLTRSGFVLATESCMAIMRGQARRLLQLDAPLDIDKEIAKLDAVTLEDVKRVIDRIFSRTPTIAVVAGNIDKDYTVYFNEGQDGK